MSDATLRALLTTSRAVGIVITSLTASVGRQ